MERPGVDRLTGRRWLSEEGDRTLFREVQYFRQVWLLALLLFLFAIMLWGFVQQIILGIPWGNNPAPDWLMILLPILMGATLLFFTLVLRLETEVALDSLVYRFFPFHLRSRRVFCPDIVEHHAITYHPLGDFGGWGIRYGRLGTAYSVSGNQGVLIRSKGDRQVLIGSRKADELDAAIGLMCKRAGDRVREKDEAPSNGLEPLTL